MVTDYVIIPNVHQDVLSAINSTTEVKEIEAVGVIETFSAASAVIAADLAAKAANVKLIEVRLARGLGGKAYVILTGEVAEVESATLKGVEYPKEQGLLVKYVVIPSANAGLIDFLL
jgi:microcompartment protein CcmL/EutN